MASEQNKPPDFASLTCGAVFPACLARHPINLAEIWDIVVGLFTSFSEISQFCNFQYDRRLCLQFWATEIYVSERQGFIFHIEVDGSFLTHVISSWAAIKLQISLNYHLPVGSKLVIENLFNRHHSQRIPRLILVRNTTLNRFRITLNWHFSDN